MDIDGIEGAGYGDTLHLMMEEELQDIEGLNVEQPLHCFYPEREPGRTPRPDAMDDLFVYDFKHMPWTQKKELDNNGGMKHNEKFIKNVKQMNGYLHDIDLPAGVIVYISSGMEVKEYVVEKHSISHCEKYLRDFEEKGYAEEHVHDKEEYDFEDILKE